MDTSSKYLSVVAAKGEKKVSRFVPECAMQHSVILMDEIDAALKEADMTPDMCDFFAAVTGPGSFTGIRIGISAAKGFSSATGKPTLGITSFDMLARSIDEKDFCVTIDALRGCAYVQRYVGGKICGSPAYMGEDEIKKIGVPLYGFEDLSYPGYRKLDISGCLQKAVDSDDLKTLGKIEATYVRKSQAEEKAECR